MKRGRYSLHALMKMRNQALEEAQHAYAKALEDTKEARKKCDEAEAIVERRRKDIDALEDSFRNASTASLVAARTLEAYPARRDLLTRKLEQARRIAQAAQDRLDEALERQEAARTALAEARKELEVIERHKERWIRDRKQKALAAEEELAEELATHSPKPM